MNDQDQKQLGRILGNIADPLRGAMNADDFRDYMLSLLFPRYLSHNYDASQNSMLSALKTHKKGLMQQLFPSPEAVEL